MKQRERPTRRQLQKATAVQELVKITYFIQPLTRLRPRSFLLSCEKSFQRYVGNFHDLETDTRNITDGVTATSESCDQDFVGKTPKPQNPKVWRSRESAFCINFKIFKKDSKELILLYIVKNKMRLIKK